MKKSKKKIQTRLKIVVATATAIFSLLSIFTATYAWFSSNTVVSVSGGSFRVSTQNYSIDSVYLYKFNYAKDSFGDFEYLFPQKGGVGLYEHTNEDTFVDVTDEDVITEAMNLYDPLQKIISGSSFHISELNTNAVYKVILKTTSPIRSVKVDGSAFLKIARSERAGLVGSGKTYFLSDYVDFDIFTQAEVDAIVSTDWYTTLTYDSAPELMTGPSHFNGEGNPNNIVGEIVGSVYENTTDGSFWVKESNGWEVQNAFVKQGNPNSDNTTPYFINSSSGNVFRYNENNATGLYGKYDLLTLDTDYSSSTSLPGNSGEIDDLYYYHNGSSHRIYRKVSNGWVKRSNVINEEIYYKIAYLSSLKDWHSHFYGFELDSISLNPNNIVYYKNNEEWIDLSLYASNNSRSFTGGMDFPSHNNGDADDYYYDYSANKVYIKDADGGWKLKSTTKKSSIVDPNTNVTFTGNNYPWLHDYSAQTVTRGNIYLYTGSPSDAYYLYVGNTDAGKTLEANWLLQEGIAYDGDHIYINGSQGDYYIYTADAMGNTDDVYLDTTGHAVYVKGTTWEKQSNVFVGSEQPYSGDYTYFIDTDDNSLKKYVNSAWSPLTPTYSGSGSPQSLYVHNGNSVDPWTLISPNMYGIGAPSINTGNDNNIYLDTSNNAVYVKSADGGWQENAVGINSETLNDYYIDLSSNKKTVTFTSDGEGNYIGTIYINANYAPSQLTNFADMLQKAIIGTTYTTYIDFGFSFAFSEEDRIS